MFGLSHKLIQTIWFWWIALTIIYVGLNLLGYPLEKSQLKWANVPESTSNVIYIDEVIPYENTSFSAFAEKNPADATLTVFAGFIGLFVPYGINAAFHFMASLLSWISVPVFIFLMFVAQIKLSSLTGSPLKKILLIFLALLIITTVIDLVRGTPLESWTIFLNGSMPNYCC